MIKDRIIGIIVVAIGVILIGVGVAISTKEVITNHNEKKEETLQTSFDGLDYTNHSFIEKDGKVYFKVTVNNLRKESLTDYQIRISFYSDEKLISYLDTNIPFLESGKKINLEIEYTKEKVSNNYIIKVEEIGASAEVG